MEKIIYLACMLVFFVVGGAGAVPQNITLGPCNVSFDLGFDEPVNGTYAEVVHTETYGGTKSDEYGFESLNISPGMVVSVGVFVDPDDWWGQASTDEWENIFLPIVSDGVCVHVYPREFDGNMGHIIVFDSVDDNIVFSSVDDDVAYSAFYIALNDTVSVSVLSTYPWNEGTTNLLNTIHIEKVT